MGAQYNIRFRYYKLRYFMLSKTNKMHYWSSIIGTNEVLTEFKKTVGKLSRGELKAANFDLKWFPKHKLYTASDNRGNRLICIIEKIRGVETLVCLNPIINHSYKKSMVEREEAFTHLLNKLRQTNFEGMIEFKDEDAAPQDAAEVVEMIEFLREAGDNLELEPVSFDGKSFIVLNDDQKQGLNSNLPLVINGAPGSGKTLLGKELLLQLLAQKPAEENRPLLYVTNSKYLVNIMKAQLNAEGISPESIHCLTYDELFKDINSRANNIPLKLIDGSDRLQWIKNHLKVQRSTLTITPEAMLEEFFVTSGCQSKAAYLSLSRHESIYASQEREIIWQNYCDYLLMLREQKLSDTLFSPLLDGNCYYALVNDESQGNTRNQLLQLGNVAPGRTIYLLDTLQCMIQQVSVRPYLTKLVPNELFLPSTYRCPVPVIKYANRWIQLRNTILGLSDKKEYSCISENKDVANNKSGKVQIITSKAQADAEIKKQADSTNFAIVISEKLKKDIIDQYKKKSDYKESDDLDILEAHFKTLLVFTPKEILGCEFDNILIYGLMDDRTGEEVSDLINDGNITLSDSPRTFNRSKNGKVDTEITVFFNQFFVSLTRTRKHLYIFEESNHKYKHLHNLVLRPDEINNINNDEYKAIESDSRSTPDPTSDSDLSTNHESSNAQDWLHTADNLDTLGNTSHADKIRARYTASIDNSNDTKQEIEKADTVAHKNAHKNKKKGKSKKNSTTASSSSTTTAIENKTEFTTRCNKSIKMVQYLLTTSNFDEIHNLLVALTDSEIKKNVLYLGDPTNFCATLLMEATKKSNDEFIKFLLTQFSNPEELDEYIDQLDDKNMTAFHYAVKYSNCSTVDIILSSISNAVTKYELIIQTAENGITALHRAVDSKNLDMVKLILSHLPSTKQKLNAIKVKTVYGNATPLMLSITSLQMDIFDEFIQYFTNDEDMADSILAVDQMNYNAFYTMIDKWVIQKNQKHVDTMPSDTVLNCIEKVIGLLTKPYDKEKLLCLNYNNEKEKYLSHELYKPIMQRLLEANQCSVFVKILKLLPDEERKLNVLTFTGVANEYDTVLITAVKKNQSHMIHIIISELQNSTHKWKLINQLSTNGKNAIYVALQAGNSEIVRILTSYATPISVKEFTNKNNNAQASLLGLFAKVEDKVQDKSLLDNLMYVTGFSGWKTNASNNPFLKLDTKEDLAILERILKDNEFGTYAVKEFVIQEKLYYQLYFTVVDFTKLSQIRQNQQNLKSIN